MLKVYKSTYTKSLFKDHVETHGPFVMQMSQKTNTDFVTGYALNLCKIHISVVPYNQNIKKVTILNSYEKRGD